MKYILYKTTNTVNGFIYIGVHKTINPNIFDGYIGCSVYINKPSSYEFPKTAFQEAVKQFGVSNFRREVLTIFDTAREAYLAEAMIVNTQYLARPDVYNMVLGGRGGCGEAVPCYQYDLEGNYISSFKSCLEASEYTGINSYNIYRAITFMYKAGNFYWSYEKTDRLNLKNCKDRTSSIKVYRYLVNSGKLDTEYDSLSSAADSTQCTLVQVARSARLGYRVGIYQFCFVKEETYDKAKSEYILSRPVYKYSSDGIFIKAYSTQKEAEYDNKYSNITKSIKNKKPCVNGFLWGLEKLPKYCSTQSKKKAVGMFDLKGILVKKWDSVKSCSKEISAVKSYLKSGKIYKKQYIFKYI